MAICAHAGGQLNATELVEAG